MRKKIFIAYDHLHDEAYKDLVVSWDADNEFEFLTKVPTGREPGSLPSAPDSGLKESVRAKIASAAAVLCLIGARTRASEWVQWEVDQAQALSKKIIVARTALTNTPLSCFLNPRTIWAKPFSFEAIKAALVRNGV